MSETNSSGKSPQNVLPEHVLPEHLGGEQVVPENRGANQPKRSLGRHVLVDFYGVRSELLTDEPALARLLGDSLREAGFHVLDLRSHKFPGEGSGVTCMALLTESHATFHTYPELNYLAIDIFCCGEPDPYVVVDAIANALNPHRADVSEQPRGVRFAGVPTK